MPLNLTKTYSQLLEIAHLGEQQRRVSLQGIFDRDMVNNSNFKFREKQIRPTKIEGMPPMQTLFHHLITRDDKDEKGKKLGTRSFEMARSVRLHWIKFHIDESKKENMEVFSYSDRINRVDVIRTYIYDREQQYVIILEPQRSGTDYYLLTAYHLNEPGGKKQIEKKSEKRLPEVY
ncbi:hypothetical protein BCY91_11995 [Pelobium manganitolerans]|uniref:Phage-Barnase-EndoU-ColicinE5/D-RelE like nuclease 2 domain-containing protein n=1 Tax=Pelobium manganitolerans TaxID=1842495 RepID=A0A419S1K8_9SPHI|nr:hypothetical protein [Pelobium manganitolerans]RKD12368.1 hypothetical protein BCY91_11995 [Pelobium manganitolerans]